MTMTREQLDAIREGDDLFTGMTVHRFAVVKARPAYFVLRSYETGADSYVSRMTVARLYRVAA